MTLLLIKSAQHFWPASQLSARLSVPVARWKGFSSLTLFWQLGVKCFPFGTTASGHRTSDIGSARG